MTTPLLTTKLYIPPIHPHLVPRPRLVKRLNEGPRLGRKLTLISAPAGFGKTTLLSEWAGQSETAVAWVSLDEDDNDPIRFLTYLVAAIQTIEENVGQGVLSALQPPQPPSLETLLTVLINQINDIPDNPLTGSRCGFVLILDDYHLITTQPVHNALLFLLDHLPGNTHLIVATRSDPPLRLARLRGRGQMAELRSADLRFTPDKVAAFLNRVMHLELSADDVATLTSRTEGWIAGLQMAAISMQGRDAEHIASFIQAFTGSDRYILDYLVEEVLNQRPSGTKDFLLQTSILDRLSGPLCDAVRFGSAESPGSSHGKAKQNDSQAVLETLEAANLFIVPLDNERRWYRYHHLFADLLRVRLKAEHPDLIPTLHRRAAVWYESHEHLTAAINHYLKAADLEAVAHLIEKNYHTFVGRGDYATLRGWIEALPQEFVSARPRLSIAYAWSLLNETDADILDAPLEDVVRACATLPADEQSENTALHSELTAIRAFQAFWRDDIKGSIELSQQALAHLPPEQRLVRGFVALNLANAHGVLGQLDAAIPAYEQVIAASQQSGNLSVTLVALGYLGEFHAVQGQGKSCKKTVSSISICGKPIAENCPLRTTALMFCTMATCSI